MKTETMFRIDKYGEILAIMPYEIADTKGNCICFCQSAGHCACSWEYVLKDTKPTNDFNNILSLMESIGYDVRVIKKRNYDRYLKEFYSTIRA